MNVYGLIGYPLTHSFSKKYFDNKFEKESITNSCFTLFEIETINKLEDLLKHEKNLKGFAITIPYKEQIIPYLHHSHSTVQQTKACNCVKIIDGKLYGYNTDVIGFEKTLLPLLTPHHTKALILGTGGAAKAVQFVLEKCKIAYTNASRKGNETQVSYSQLNETILQSHKLIINCTPLGTFPNSNECPPIPYDCITAQHLLVDLVYNPPQTLFLQKGMQQGARVCNGYDMLLWQAEENWKIWSDDNEN